MSTSLILLVAFLLMACGEKEQASTEASSSAASKNQETATKAVKQVTTGAKTISKACEAISSDQVASIMGWDAAGTKSEETFNMKEGRITVCHFTNAEKEGSISLRVSKENEKAIEFKKLENNYARYLAEGEKNLTYESVAGSPGSETLYGVGDAMHGMKAHVLRTRFGNEFDTTVETMSDGSDLSGVKAQLLAVAQALQ